VTHPDWEVGDDEVDEQLEQMRERFAEVDEVERPAASGRPGHPRPARRGRRRGARVRPVSDALYEVGSGGVTPILDEEIVGKQAGDEFSYEDSLPDDYPDHGGAQATFHVSVTDVREKSLPALDDDFATTASAFDTLDELRADVRASLQRMRIQQAGTSCAAACWRPTSHVSRSPCRRRWSTAEVESGSTRLEHQAEQYGMDIGQLLELQGTTRDEFEEQAARRRAGTVKARLVLDELAQHARRADRGRGHRGRRSPGMPERAGCPPTRSHA
jgi:trigger factor